MKRFHPMIRWITVLWVLLLLPAITEAFNTRKTVLAKVVKSDNTFPSNTSVIIRVTDGNHETVIYQKGSDPKSVITYEETKGQIYIAMGNFTAQWANGQPITIQVQDGNESAASSTTLASNMPTDELQAYTADKNLSLKLSPGGTTTSTTSTTSTTATTTSTSLSSTTTTSTTSTISTSTTTTTPTTTSTTTTVLITTTSTSTTTQLTTTTSSTTIPIHQHGDLNGNGIVDIYDALYIAQYIVGEIPDAELINRFGSKDAFFYLANVDNTGVSFGMIDIWDAVQIAYMSLSQ